MVGEEQFGVYVQARDVAFRFHFEFGALQWVVYLEFVGLGWAAKCFRLELHLQLEFLFLFKDPVWLIVLLPLWQLLFREFLYLLVLGIFAYGVEIFDFFILFDPTLLFRQES